MSSAASGPAGDWDDLATLFRGLVQDAGASGGMLFLLPPGEPVLQLAMLYGSPWGIAAPWSRIRMEESIPAAEAARERRLVWVGSSEEMALNYPRLALVVPDHTVAASPIIVGDAVLGTVCLLWPSSHSTHLRREESEVLDTFCRQAGLVLQRGAKSGDPLLPGIRPVLLEPVRLRTPDRAEALAAYDFAVRLPGAVSLDLEGRITFLNDTAADLLGAPAVDLLDACPWERLQWLGDPTFEDRFRDTVISRRPTHFTARRSPDLRLSFQLYPDDTGVSVHIDPFRTASSAGTEQPVRSLAEPPEATTIYHLMHLAASLTETVRVEDVADKVGDQLLPAFGAAGLALMTADDGRLRVVGHQGYSAAFMARFDGESLAAGSPPARALTSHRPLFFTSFAEFKRAYPDAVRYGDRDAWAFLPLLICGRPVGILVLSYDQARHFPPTERNLLVSVAGLIAQALDRARLYDAKDNLARTLQNGLLPHRLPDVPGLRTAARYLPAGHGMDVGGDFYDLIRCGPASAAAAIGDVQGHNVQAAALMGQLRTAVHTQAMAGMRPDELLARTNQVMYDFDSGLFASCLYVHLDLAGGSARLATAGHLPPLLRHPDRRTEILELPAGPLLGVTADAEYSTVEIPLPPGTTIALYTDGLVEVPGADINRAIVSLADRFARARDDDLEALIDTLLHHGLRSVPRTDDIAMLLIHTAT
ncbi:SpoIIE family protein phosphatase [Streptomyces sp. AS58]|uniref:SpoIIE family protein phosphatase n=1 Tax=Streptomyces sp. AS58 TaxID=1519489 RepID=UPI0006AF8D64|nr:SpoIIE family protein phosphatase [Streptomyces sp. AS58]